MFALGHMSDSRDMEGHWLAETFLVIVISVELNGPWSRERGLRLPTPVTS